MEIKPIRTKRDYEAALKEIERLMDAKRKSPEGARLDVLVTLVEAYETKHYPLDLPDPVESIKLAMEQRGNTPLSLVEVAVPRRHGEPVGLTHGRRADDVQIPFRQVRQPLEPQATADILKASAGMTRVTV